MSKLTTYILGNKFLLGFGFLLSFLSSFGQTFLLSLYLPFLQEEFELTDGGFSSIYSAATLCSAFTITWLGRYIDKVRLTRFTIFVLLGLVFSIGLLSQAYSLTLLFISLFGLRLFGQGMMTHTSITSMARFFEEARGKAISIGSLGHSFGEAILPILIVTCIAWVDWRYTLIISMIFVLFSIPFSNYLLRKNAHFNQLRKYIPQPFSQQEEKQTQPLEIIKTKAFWILLPSSLAAASIGTGFLLFKLKLGISKGWDPAFIAAGFTSYAIGNALSNLFAGFLSDRYSGKILFPFYLLPFSVGLIMLLVSDEIWVYLGLITGIGATNGFGSTVKNVAMAELYGTRILGSVRSLFTTVTVFSTALGPVFFGLLLDRGYSYEFLAGLSLALFAVATFNALRIHYYK